MPVWIRNLQNAVTFNKYKFELQCNFLLRALRLGEFDVGVMCVERTAIQEINRVYRNCNEPTDVLSFPYHEVSAPGALPALGRQCDYNLGDVFLGMPVIAEQCEREAGNLEGLLPVVITHGFCHLVGYKHHSTEEIKMMFRKELSLLTAFNHSFGTELSPLTTNMLQDSTPTAL